MTDTAAAAHEVPTAYQGEPGAFGEDALIAYFGAQGERLAQPGFGDVFTAVAEGAATAGIVPIENSLHGSVLEVCDLLLARDVVVIGEVTVPVRHCLLGRPGAALADIVVAHSHPQALAQSRGFLEEHGIEARAATNTARAARDLAAGDDANGDLATHAAIASERAAAIYGLDVLARDVQRSSSNTTRFVVLARVAAHGSPEPTKVMLAYTTANEPGALHRTLGLFAQLEVNLTRLESRPTRDTPWEYDFFIDCERAGRVAFDDLFLGELVAKLGGLAQRVRVLGAFAAAPVD